MLISNCNWFSPRNRALTRYRSHCWAVSPYWPSNCYNMQCNLLLIRLVAQYSVHSRSTCCCCRDMLPLHKYHQAAEEWQSWRCIPLYKALSTSFSCDKRLDRPLPYWFPDRYRRKYGEIRSVQQVTGTSRCRMGMAHSPLLYMEFAGWYIVDNQARANFGYRHSIFGRTWHHVLIYVTAPSSMPTIPRLE